MDPAERRRAIVIALFLTFSIALALVLAYFYALPAAD